MPYIVADSVSGHEPSHRQAQTRVPIHPAIAGRWSPRAFDSTAVLLAEQMIALLEAARWAATWGQRQPVRFIVGVRGDETFTVLADLLNRGNRYAAAAGALILICADEGEDEKTARYAAVDAGAAIAQLSFEAQTRSLIVHPMAGFDHDSARSGFGIPPHVRPLAVVAVGTLDRSGACSPEAASRDSAPRTRLPLEAIAFAQQWDQPYNDGAGDAPTGTP